MSQVDVNIIRTLIDSKGAKKGSDETIDSLKKIKSQSKDTTDGLSVLQNKLSVISDGFGGVSKAVGLAGVGISAFTLGKTIAESTLLAARVETLHSVMGAVGNSSGYSAKEMDGYAKGVAHAGITTEASRQAVVRMSQANMNLSKSQDMARIAQDAAVIAQTNSSDAFERMIVGIATGQVEILRNMGIMTNFEAAYDRAAKAVGKNSKQLTEHEKVAAREAEVIRASASAAGAYEAAMDTAGKQMTSMTRYSQEAQLSLGEVFTPTYTLIIRDMSDGLKEMAFWMKELSHSDASKGIKTTYEEFRAVVAKGFHGTGYLGNKVLSGAFNSMAFINEGLHGKGSKDASEMRGWAKNSQSAADYSLDNFEGYEQNRENAQNAIDMRKKLWDKKEQQRIDASKKRIATEKAEEDKRIKADQAQKAARHISSVNEQYRQSGSAYDNGITALNRQSAENNIKLTEERFKREEIIEKERYEKGLITADNYYKTINGLSEQSTKDKIAAINQELEAIKGVQSERAKELSTEREKLNSKSGTEYKEQAIKVNKIANEYNQVLGKTLGLENERQSLQEQLQTTLVKNSQQQRDDIEKNLNSEAQLNIELTDRLGLYREALILKRALMMSGDEYKGMQTRANAGDSGAKRWISNQDSLFNIDMNYAQGRSTDFNRSKIEFDSTKKRNAVGNNLDDISKMIKLDEIRKNEIADLQKLAAEYDKLADSEEKFGSQENVLRYRQVAEELKSMRNEASKTRETFEGMYTDGLSNFFEDAMNGTKNVKDAFRDMALDIVHQMQRMVSQMIAQKIMKSAFGNMLSDGTGSMFGAASSGSMFGGMYADGGDPPLGKISLVGERGPELFVPKTAGTIIPNHMISGNNSSSISLNLGGITVSVKNEGSGAGNQNVNQIAQMAEGLKKQMEAVAIRTITNEMRNGGVLAGRQ